MMMMMTTTKINLLSIADVVSLAIPTLVAFSQRIYIQASDYQPIYLFKKAFILLEAVCYCREGSEAESGDREL